MGFRVAAGVPAGCAVEANVNDIAGDNAGGFFAGHVVNAEAGAGFIEQVVGIVGVPAFVPEFEDGGFSFGQQPYESFEQVEIFVQAGRQLVEDWAERVL